MSEPLHQFAVYYDPKDYPGKYVVRRWVILSIGAIPGACKLADTLEAARALVPDGLTNIGRSKGDDPCIVEVWT